MLRIRSLLALTAVVSGVFASSAAFAAEPAAGGGEFGEAGVINFAAATSLGIEHSSTKTGTGDPESTNTSFNIHPSIDYFVADGVSIGAEALIQSSKTKPEGASDSSGTTTIGIGPRVGYNLWLTPGQLSLWPLIGITYASTSFTSKGQDAGSGSKLALGVFVPLVIHPVKHFHFAIGPFLGLDLSSKQKPVQGDSVDGSKDTTFGIRAEIAGWL